MLAGFAQALRQSDFVLVFLSQHSVAKQGFVQREFKLTLDVLEDLPEDSIHTIPVRLDNCEVPERLQDFHWANLFESDGFDKIVQAIRSELSNRPGAAAAPSLPIASTPLSSLTNSIGMELILIPAGHFMMGDNQKRRVDISQPFYLGKYAVTQTQWEAVMGNNPSHFKGPDRPVENISWEDAQVFIQKLNEREGVSHYRLPTEAQWEYACRAGSITVYYFGNDATKLGDYAWYDANSGHSTHPVGQLQPNAWGLYDMHGNVREWCQDWYDANLVSAAVDPQGLSTGADRVIRGGSWSLSAWRVRSTCRGAERPAFRYVNLGFRCSSSVPSK